MQNLCRRDDHRFAVAPAQCPSTCEGVIREICAAPWENASTSQLIQVAKVYYYFSVQFRENMEIACRLYPGDRMLEKLYRAECDTDNLSPWPGVAADRERLNHDEFVRRLLLLERIERDNLLTKIGEDYLDFVRGIGDPVRASSIGSYEDGGLSRVFTAILRAPDWHGPGALAFRFFLERHIQFDDDENEGHGALVRHLQPSDKVAPLWMAFRDLLYAALSTAAPAHAGAAGRSEAALLASPV